MVVFGVNKLLSYLLCPNFKIEDINAFFACIERRLRFSSLKIGIAMSHKPHQVIR